MPPNHQPTYFVSSTELADLGAARFDHDTAAVGNKDYALTSNTPVTVQAGRAPRGLENQVFAWTTFQYTTAGRDEREEKKGDLHEGQLHRQNRAAVTAHSTSLAPRAGDGCARGRQAGAGKRSNDNGQPDALCAGRKPEGNALPLAKGFAKELEKSMFWDQPIV